MENDVKETVMPNPGGAVMTQRQLALLEYVLDPGLVAMVVPEVVMVCVPGEHCAPEHARIPEVRTHEITRYLSNDGSKSVGK